MVLLGNGNTVDSKAFLKAWNDLCQGSDSGGTPTVTVPAESNFLVKPVSFRGPCRSKNVHVQIQGAIVAPDNVEVYGGNKDAWLQFSKVDGLTIDGGGTIDGRGSVWWNHCRKDSCRPTALRFRQCNGLQLKGMQQLNSRRNHVSITTCQGVLLSGLHMEAPGTSPNTDGVDISSSTQITIQDSVIATGDDCVAIKGGSSYINITGVQCGPGHGISVGRLGKNGGNESLEEIHVRNCSFNGTTNGARIKTWQGWRGYARKITFENITLASSKNPTIIDGKYDTVMASSTGRISEITNTQVQGSSASKRAIFLDCSCCNNIVMDRVNITFSSPYVQTFAFCHNANGTQVSTSPSVPCLSNATDVQA